MQKKSSALMLTALAAGLIVAHLSTAQVSNNRASSRKQEKTMTATPIACNLAAMTPAQRDHHAKIIRQLRAAVREVKELPEGYAFRYTADPELVTKAAAFVTLESRCCPFFDFALEVTHNGGPVWLRVTGPMEAKPIIKAIFTS